MDPYNSVIKKLWCKCKIQNSKDADETAPVEPFDLSLELFDLMLYGHFSVNLYCGVLYN